LKRFEREAKRMAKFTHPNIMQIIDYGEYENAPYLVMPYLQGGTLRDLLAGRDGKPFNVQEACRLLAPLARALEYAHEQDTIHRDVKPANILLTTKGQPLLTDFGVAKILDLDEGNTLTGTGVGVGTPEYMAPEQWVNKVVPQTDVYALGVVFYEMVTGRKPYAADTPAAVLVKQATEPLPRPRGLNPDIPEEAERVLYKALAKEPLERYADMATFAEALEKLASLAPNTSPASSERMETIDYTPATSTAQTSSTASVWEVSPGSQPPSVRPNREYTPIPPPSVSKPSLEKGEKKGGVPGWVWGLLVTAALVIGVLVLLLVNVIKPPPATPAPAARQESPTIAVPQEAPTEKPAPQASDGETRTSNKDGMVSVYIPAGEFLMGSTDGDRDAQNDEKPQHTVYLDGYWIDKTEVTNGMYRKCVASGGCKEPYSKSSNTRSDYYGNSTYADYPVIYVDWDQANAYCGWAGRRLPSEAEWEKAARGTDGRKYPWGNEDATCELANYEGKNNGKDYCVGDTTEVGSYPRGASPYGIMDMAGNVWEWVNDWYDGNYYQNSPSKNPQGPESGSERVLRGGSWVNDSRSVRAANRGWNVPVNRDDYSGFRCVRLP
jgi:serine/threonine-protein kinase